jgi:hypothetical protein
MPRQGRSAADAPRRILNCLPSPSPQTDWSFGSAVKAGLSATALPASVDLREAWWEVGDQGDTGSCVGWAMADSVLRYHFTKAGWIGEGDRLSVRFAWMAAKELDEFSAAPTTFIEPEGTSLKAALDVARKYGAVLERYLPFRSGALFPDTAEVFYGRAAQLKVASYASLGVSLTSWRRWLANNGPILVRLDVDRTWANANGANPELAAYLPETAQGGHAVALVGYTPNGFIVRNSWGLTWGDSGFAFASNAYAAAAFTEAYGVTLSGAADGATSAGRSDAGERFFAVAGWSIQEIETLVVDVASEIRNRDISLGDDVRRWFSDLQGVVKVLAGIQKALGVDDLLTEAPAAEILGLLEGDVFACADWIYRRLGGGA